MALSRAQQPHSGTRGPGREANVQSRNPQKERPKFLLFPLSLFYRFQIAASPLLAHGCVPPGWCHREDGGTCCCTVVHPWVIHPAEPSQQAFLSFPASQTLHRGEFRANQVATGGGYGQGLWDKDCQAGKANAGLVGAQARANCAEAK